MQPENKQLKLVSCEGCREQQRPRGAAASSPKARQPSKQLQACRSGLLAAEQRIEDLEADLRDAEERAAPEGLYSAQESTMEALKAAREALHRWKLGTAALKPSAEELAATIAQIIEDLKPMENLM